MTRVLLFLALGVCSQCSSQMRDQFSELELITIQQQLDYSDIPLELSGMVKFQDKIYVVSDNYQDNYLYGLEFSDSGWFVKDSISIEAKGKIDLEAVGLCDGTFFIANEKSGAVIRKNLNNKPTIVDIKFEQSDPVTWGNAGWEGLAVDCSNQVMYLVKERQPRNIFVIDMMTFEIKKSFNIAETESNDFADAWFENNHLYLIERNGNFITKINPDTEEVVDKVSYRETCNNPDGKLYQPTEYGMAEALLMTETEIWLGLDTNGLEVSDFARKKFGMTGSAPAIIRFKRPEGF